MTPEDLVKRNVQLVSLPEICIQVQALADSPHTTADDVAEVVGKDTALTVRVLKLVNNRYAEHPHRIDTVSRAVDLIGMRELRNVALAASPTEVFGSIPSDLIDMADFWQHSVFTGLTARHLARCCNVLHSERLFTAGLLHDVGRLLMLMELPEQAARAESLRLESGEDICDIEQRVVGFDHAEIGQALLMQWNLPETLCASVLYHHNPRIALSAPIESALVHIADQVAHCAQESRHRLRSPSYDPYAALLDADLNAARIGVKACEKIQKEALSLTSVSTADIAEAVSASSAAFNQVLELLYPMAWGTPR
ncbi:MAG: HDOD domain-containing protein [Gammaproteobacteria bacterium]